MARQLLVTNIGMSWVTADPAGTVTAVTANGGQDMIGLSNGEALVPESISGFTTSPSQVDVPDYTTLTVGKIPGPLTIDDTSMEYYYDDTTNDIFDYMQARWAADENGWILVWRGAQVAAATMPCDVWPAQIQSIDTKFTGNTEADKWVLNVALGVPDRNILIT